MQHVSQQILNKLNNLINYDVVFKLRFLHITQINNLRMQIKYLRYYLFNVYMSNAKII